MSESRDLEALCAILELHMPKKGAKYDVVVIGGGPAGMIAAGRAAECGASVLLLEKNPSLGKKLLITGGGRCNLTNNENDPRRFLAKFKNRQKFLFSPFAQFGVKETLDFFHEHGLETKVEAEGRVFPASNSAKSVLESLQGYLHAHKVTILNSTVVDGFSADEEKIIGLKIKNSKEVILVLLAKRLNGLKISVIQFRSRTPH